MEEEKRIIPGGEIEKVSNTPVNEEEETFELEKNTIVYDDEVRENLELLPDVNRRFVISERPEEIDFYFIPPKKPSFKEEVDSAIGSLLLLGVCAGGDTNLVQRGILKVYLNAACQDFRCRTAIIDKMLGILRV